MGTKKQGLAVILFVIVIQQSSDAGPCPILNIVPSGYTSKTFDSASDLLANPARGFYIHTEVITSNYNELTRTYIVNEQNNNGGPATVGMVFRHIVLDDYVTRNLTSTVISHIRNDLEAVKAAGVLAILRFSYTVTYFINRNLGGITTQVLLRRFNSTITRSDWLLPNNAPPYGDGNKTTILSHIENLKLIFRDYQGVIAVVQAGFIGVWGEWYYSDHFGVPGNGLSAQNLQDRKDVLDALIAAVPGTIQIQVRTPKYKYDIYGLTPTMYRQVQYRTPKSRVGHHNDCFLASSSDFGTYQNTTIEYPYLRADTKYTVMAGETCSLSSESRHQCSTALSELQMFHWTSVNILYNQQVIQFWKDNGCFTTINQRLGYRLRVKSVVLPSSTNGRMCVKLTLTNEGFAAPIRQYDIKLVLRSTSGALYRTQALRRTLVRSRTWLPGSNHVVSGSVRLPCGIPVGLYRAYLELSDRLVPGNKAYNVLLANMDVPDTSLRLNFLKHSIQVTATPTEDNSVCPSGCFNADISDGSFENNPSSWYNFSDGFLRVSGGAKDGSYYIEVTNGGAYQDIDFLAGTRKFIVKGWSRHQGTVSVSNPADYSIYCDVTLSNGTSDLGRTANFHPNSIINLWESVTLQVTETMDIESARCYAMFRNGVGVAEFDNFKVWACPA